MLKQEAEEDSFLKAHRVSKCPKGQILPGFLKGISDFYSMGCYEHTIFMGAAVG